MLPQLVVSPLATVHRSRRSQPVVTVPTDTSMFSLTMAVSDTRGSGGRRFLHLSGVAEKPVNLFCIFSREIRTGGIKSFSHRTDRNAHPLELLGACGDHRPMPRASGKTPDGA